MAIPWLESFVTLTAIIQSELNNRSIFFMLEDGSF